MQARRRLGRSTQPIQALADTLDQRHGHRRERAALVRDPRQRPRNVSEIAYAWGFNDLSYFNRTFRQRFDATPREWREDAHVIDRSPDVPLK